MGEFLTDIKTIRERARREINEGAVTPDYGLDKEKALITNDIRLQIIRASSMSMTM